MQRRIPHRLTKIKAREQNCCWTRLASGEPPTLETAALALWQVSQHPYQPSDPLGPCCPQTGQTLSTPLPQKPILRFHGQEGSPLIPRGNTSRHRTETRHSRDGPCRTCALLQFVPCPPHQTRCRIHTSLCSTPCYLMEDTVKDR